MSILSSANLDHRGRTGLRILLNMSQVSAEVYDSSNVFPAKLQKCFVLEVTLPNVPFALEPHTLYLISFISSFSLLGQIFKCVFTYIAMLIGRMEPEMNLTLCTAT